MRLDRLPALYDILSTRCTGPSTLVEESQVEVPFDRSCQPEDRSGSEGCFDQCRAGDMRC